MDAGALRRAGNVAGRVGGRQHLVNDVDEAVAGNHVRHGDVRIVDHHPVADGEGQRLTVGRIGRHAVRDVGGRHLSTHHVVKQNVGARPFLLDCPRKRGRCPHRQTLGR